MAIPEPVDAQSVLLRLCTIGRRIVLEDIALVIESHVKMREETFLYTLDAAVVCCEKGLVFLHL